jgi:hypothetical protein
VQAASIAAFHAGFNHRITNGAPNSYLELKSVVAKGVDP